MHEFHEARFFHRGHSFQTVTAKSWLGLRKRQVETEIYDDVVLFVAILCSISMLVGMMMALVQDDIKRMLAYSGIAQMGYAAIALATFQGEAFEALLRRSSIWLAVTFIASAPVNYALARYILRSPPGTPEFNAQLGRMHLLVWPVIVVPCMIVMMGVFWRLITGLKQITGLSTDAILRTEEKS